MKKTTDCAPNFPGKTAGIDTPPRFGICIVEEPPSPTAPVADPAPVGATARRTAPEDAPAPAEPDSVVSKVARLLVRQGHKTVWEPPIHQENGCLHQKIMTSLQAKQPV